MGLSCILVMYLLYFVSKLLHAFVWDFLCYQFQSTGSFFHDKSITLGSLIGASSIQELPRRSARIRIAESCRDKRSYKSKSWFFSLCSKLNTDAVTINGAQSLGYFLEAERRAAGGYRRNRNLALCRPSYLAQDPPASDSRALCVGGQVATNSTIPMGADGKRNPQKVQVDDLNAYGVPLFFSCLRGQIIGWWHEIAFYRLVTV